AVTAGWLLDLPALESMGCAGPPTKINTAVGLTFAGAALGLGGVGGRSRFVAARIVLAWLAWAIGTTTLAEHLFHVDLGLDQALAHDPLPVLTGAAGRPSLIAALDLVFVGGALIRLDARPSWRVRPS